MKKIQLANDFTLEEDNAFKLHKEIKGWEPWEALEYLHSRDIARFRYILSQHSIDEVAYIYALSPQDLKMRILVHLSKKQQIAMFQFLKTQEAREFLSNHEEVKFFKSVLEFSLMVS
jgi:Mg/Co/Ni transporter MgtE